MIQDTIMETISKEINNGIKKNFFKRLFDSNDTSVSATNVFLIVITAIGLLLLLVPAVVLLVEIFYNHTIATDLSGMAAYVGSVAGLFATGGITKAWSNWSNYKYNGKRTKEYNKLFDSSNDSSESNNSINIDDIENYGD